MTASAAIINLSNWAEEDIVVSGIDMYEDGEAIDSKRLKPGEMVKVYPGTSGIQPRITLVGWATEPFRNEHGHQVFPEAKVIWE